LRKQALHKRPADIPHIEPLGRSGLAVCGRALLYIFEQGAVLFHARFKPDGFLRVAQRRYAVACPKVGERAVKIPFGAPVGFVKGEEKMNRLLIIP
jgi:hypothetical protein